MKPILLALALLCPAPVPASPGAVAGLISELPPAHPKRIVIGGCWLVDRDTEILIDDVRVGMKQFLRSLTGGDCTITEIEHCGWHVERLVAVGDAREV